MFSYAVKRVTRSLGLFAALLLGVALASTFFAGVNIGADTTAKAALKQQLNQVPVDILVSKYGMYSHSAEWTAATSKVSQVNGIVSSETISRVYWYGNTTFENYTSLNIAGVSNTSRVYEGLTITLGADSLGVNETYVWVNSKSASKIELNSTLALIFSYWPDYTQPAKNLSVSLKVVGLVELDDTAYSIASGNWYGPVILQPLQDRASMVYGENLLIVSWEETFARLLDAIPISLSSYSSPFSTQILAYMDRDALINPWDISGSAESVRAITNQVSQVVADYGMSASNNLEQALFQYQFLSMAMRLSFFAVALPVFFVAWYVGTTVSDVSYNLRRREIGLLLTKGFSTGQLFRMFLTESVLIGVIGGLIGVGLGFILGPFFATAAGSELGTAPVLTQEVVALAIIFGLAMTLLSTYRPSRRASKLPPITALREYMYVEEVKPYRQRLPWIAFSLGTYKIVMFLFGISNIAQLFMGRPLPSSNIFIVILLGAWMAVDYVLVFIGPLLFFWGFSKIFIRGSLKFQELVTRVARFLGDLGTLATRNVQRNPARTASVAFLIALIVGYSFQTIGSVSSEQDYTIRKVKADVGADVSVLLASTANISHTAIAIEALSGVTSTTTEYSLSGSLPSQYYTSLQFRVVDPSDWLSTAYYEDQWFSGNDVTTAFQQMMVSNRTVILERNIAKTLDKKVGDDITLNLGVSTISLRIVGFFGPEIVQQPSSPGPVGSYFWSFVPFGLYKSLSESVYASTTILVKLELGANNTAVTSEILSLGDINSVRSVAKELESSQSNLLLTGPLNIQRIGVVFSILAASLATCLVTLVSLQERRREASIMSARGLSFKQLVTMLLSENMAVIAFAAILGIIVGLIVVRGNVAASDVALYSLVVHRMIFPPDAILLLSTCLILVFASVVIPVILLVRRYVSKIERIVRL